MLYLWWDVISHAASFYFHSLGDIFSACFLIDNGIDPNHTTYEHKTSALHLVPTCSLSDEDKAKVSSSLLQAGAQANQQDYEGR